MRVIRGDILHFFKDPGAEPDAAAWQLIADGALVVEAGLVRRLGPAADILPHLPAGIAIDDHRGRLILPGFVDTHVHSVQIDVIASYGSQLLDWLEHHTFPAERKFANSDHCRAMADTFLDTLLRNGTTSAGVFASVHKQSADALLAAARARHLRIIAGKVMMDRNCPADLRDDVASAEADNRDLIARWHGQDRLTYALTPRFAPTSSPEQLAMTGRLLAEMPNLRLQSHLAENRDEVAWVGRLFPDSRSYLDVYDGFGLVRPGAVYAHCLHLAPRDRERMAEAGAAIAFCPTSNLFIGSGLFDLEAARKLGIRVGLATDVGGGTSYSLLETLAEGYKVLQLQGQNLNPWRGFYLATLGGAEALRLEDRIGNFLPGKEADCVVLDFQATQVLARRADMARDFAERLFALMMLGDDRAIVATYILGEPAFRRV